MASLINCAITDAKVQRPRGNSTGNYRCVWVSRAVASGVLRMEKK